DNDCQSVDSSGDPRVL
nr:immunoglobulin light chain junction region [Macaca mulatta]